MSDRLKQLQKERSELITQTREANSQEDRQQIDFYIGILDKQIYYERNKGATGANRFLSEKPRPSIDEEELENDPTVVSTKELRNRKTYS